MENSIINHHSKIFRRTLVTGDKGFVGQYAMANIPGTVGLTTLNPDIDIRNKESILDSLNTYQPDAVLHLAALSFVPESFKSPETAFEVNFLGTLRLLEALTETGFKGRFLYVGTGDAYGKVNASELPIHEERLLRPLNPYAVSKAATEALCFQWSQTSPFEVVMARPFNHIGAGQSPYFSISNFAKQIAEIAAGIRPAILNVGNLESTRDFTDVRDVVRAYELMLNNAKNGEIYNVCSGIERSIKILLTRLLDLTGVVAEISVDSTRYRPTDQPRVCGSYEKLNRQTGWKPEIPIDETLLNLYRYWEKKINDSQKESVDHGNNRTGRSLSGKTFA